MFVLERGDAGGMFMIQVNDRLPEATLFCRGPQGLDGVAVQEITEGRTVALFAVPGAFTPTCSQRHVPGFLSHADELCRLGVDEIFCVSVNDPFVLRVWAEQLGADERVRFLSDGNASFTHALGMERDMTSAAMGIRSKRYAMLVEDGVVRWLGVDESGLEQAAAETLLAALKALPPVMA